MKQMRGMNSKNTILGVAIFVLWSLGIIFIPDLRSSAQPHVMFQLVAVYLLLHVAIFIFAAMLLKQSLNHFTKKNRVQKNTARWYALLYGYVLLSLAISAYLIIHTLYL